MRRVAAKACVIGLVLSACRSSLDPRLHGQSRAQAEAVGPSDDRVRVTFLGAQGFLIERGKDVVLTAPLFSNPKFETVLDKNGVLNVDDAAIDRFLPDDWLTDLDAVVVGHAHYDHLMDVPYVMKKPRVPAGARVFGNATMTHLVAPALHGRTVSVTPNVDYRMCVGLKTCDAANHEGAGSAVPVVGDPNHGPAVRLFPLCSDHSSQFAGLDPLWSGCQTTDRTSLPQHAAEWKMGDTLSYLIDFLEDGKPVFRVYYQDSPAKAPYGFAPKELLRDKAVDLAILCGGAFDQVQDNPGGILENLGHPRHILLGHWDDFFTKPSDKVVPLRGQDFDDLVRALERATGARPWEGRYHLPAPGTSFVYPVALR